MIRSVRHELKDAYSFAQLCEMAAECREFPSRVDVNDDVFLAPDSMTEAIQDYCRRTGQTVPWMVPGGRAIAVETSKLMEKYDAAIWAHHGLFCSGEDFDLTFGLVHTIEKSAEILVKVRSMQPYKLQTIRPDEFRALAKDFKVTLPEEFLYEKKS